MSLEYPGEWKFEDINISIDKHAMNDFKDLIQKIASGNQNVIEQFKANFGGVGYSSNYGWAYSDLEDLLHRSADNAILFIDNYWKSIEVCKELGITTPTVQNINKILQDNDIPLKIDFPHLIQTKDSEITSESQMDDMDYEGRNQTFSYKIGDEIGRGGFGIVYQTIRTTRISSFKYAIKILDPSPFISNYEKAVERFSREISALSKLQHRAIVNCIDAGLTIDNKPYIVMSYIDGIDLRTASSSMNDYQKATMILEVLHALEYTHENEIIHRDLKPSNIIVRTSDMQPVVLDFGCSFIFDELNETSLTTTAVGSIGYIPSEIIVNPKKRTALQDIYACGIIFYELFFRSKPDPHNYVPLASVNEKWNIFDPLIKKAISNENNRYQTAKEFYDDLIEVLDDI